MHDNFVDQTAADSPATLTSTAQPIKQLTTHAAATFTIAHEYIDLASVLSEAVPTIAPALQEIIALVVKQRDLNTRLHLKAEDTEPAQLTTDIVNQETEEFKTSIKNIARDRHNMLMEYYAERRRQGQMSFNVANWLVPGLLILGTVIIVIGVIVALMHNVFVGISVGLAGGIVDAISIARSLNKETNDRFDPHIKELLILTQFDSSMEYIEKISDAEKKDNAILNLTQEISDFVKKLA